MKSLFPNVGVEFERLDWKVMRDSKEEWCIKNVNNRHELREIRGEKFWIAKNGNVLDD